MKKDVLQIGLVGVGHFGTNLLNFLLDQEGIQVNFCVESDLKQNHLTEILLAKKGSKANIFDNINKVDDEPDFIDVVIDCSRNGQSNNDFNYKYWKVPVIFQASEESVVGENCPLFTNESKVKLHGSVNNVKIPHCSSLIAYEILKSGYKLNDLQMRFTKNFGEKLQTFDDGPGKFIPREIEALLADNCDQHTVGFAEKFTEVTRTYLPNPAGVDNVYLVNIYSKNIQEKVRKLRISSEHVKLENPRQISDNVDNYLHIQQISKNEIIAYAYSPELAINWNMRALRAYANVL
jgi:hypothetical protein